MIHVLKALLLTGALAVTVSAEAGKAGYYRWVDDEGKVNFTQQPPVGRESEFVASDTGRSVPSSDTEPAADSSAPAETAGNSTPPPQRLEVLPEKDPARCTQAKNFLQQLGNKSRRVRVRDESGEPRLLSDDEIAEQQQRAQEMIDIHC